MYELYKMNAMYKPGYEGGVGGGPVRWVWEHGLGVLVYIVVCAAPPAARVGELVVLGQRRGWELAVIASPDALQFLDVEGLERATGHPVRSLWRRPDEPSSVPDADAVVVAPATFNTLNKWVAGVADTVASATVSEYLGRSVPMVAAPCVNPDLARHPTFRANLGVLAGWGVRLLFDDSAPRADRMAPWSRIADELESAIAARAGGEGG
jgi:phosphopantothenoylcysteine synthetase/decarboxylase